VAVDAPPPLAVGLFVVGEDVVAGESVGEGVGEDVGEVGAGEGDVGVGVSDVTISKVMGTLALTLVEPHDDSGLALTSKVNESENTSLSEHGELKVG